MNIQREKNEWTYWMNIQREKNEWTYWMNIQREKNEWTYWMDRKKISLFKWKIFDITMSTYLS